MKNITKTFTVTFLVQDIAPIFDTLVYNIFALEEFDWNKEGYDEAMKIYKDELEKLKPIYKQSDPINYSIYEACNFDYETHEDFMKNTDGLDYDMEG
jgi:hypothetical protein